MRRRRINNLSLKYRQNQTLNTSVETPTDSSTLFETGLVISLLTGLGYIVAYAYKKGYWIYYGLTQEFLIEISIVNILISTTFIGTIFGLLALQYYGVKSTMHYYDKSVYRKVFEQLILPRMSFVIIIYLLFPRDILKLKPIHIIPAYIFIIIISFILPLFLEHKIKGYENKLKMHIKRRHLRGFTLNNIISGYKRNLTFKITYLIMILITCYILPYALGYNNAFAKKDYLIINFKDENYIVLDSNRDNLLIAPIDLKNGEISQSYQLINVTSDFDNPIVFKNILLRDGVKIKAKEDLSNF